MISNRISSKWRRALTRRQFIQSGSTTAALLAFGIAPRSSADELPRVNEDDPIAKALSYVHDAKSVDAARRASDRFCYNCALYAGDADDEWAGCSVFPGKAVAGAGWCGAWAPKQDS